MYKKLRPIWWIYKYVEKKHIPKAILPNFLRVKLSKYIYENIHNRKLDLNNPKRFSEKIVWYMLFYDNKDFKNILCKAEFKDYVKDKIGEGYTAKLYGAWTNVDDIDWESLPESFVLKSNCNSFGRCIKFIDNKNEIDFEKLKDEIRPWISNVGLYSFARGYYEVVPKIMAEEMLGEARNQPIDYKFFCFNGVPTYCYSAFEHFDNGVAQSSKIAFYDSEWNALPVKYKKSQCIPVDKPIHFDEMKEVAKTLSKDFPFVRVDFYDSNEKFYVGELTFYSGSMSNSYTPDSFDYEMGSFFELPPKQRFRKMSRKELTNK